MDKQYYISKDGQQLGPFTETQLVDQVKSGAATANDLCWTEGMEGWKPVRDVISLPATPPPPPQRPSGGKSTRPGIQSPRQVDTPVRKSSGYTDISEVPWIRRSNNCSGLIILSVLTGGFFPGILVVCIVALSGKIYYEKRYDKSGALLTWSVANKVVACALVVFWLIYLVGVLSG